MRLRNIWLFLFYLTVFYLILIVEVNIFGILYLASFLCITVLFFPPPKTEKTGTLYSYPEIALFSLYPIAISFITRNFPLSIDKHLLIELRPDISERVLPSFLFLTFYIIPFIWILLVKREGLKKLGFRCQRKHLFLIFLIILPVIVNDALSADFLANYFAVCDKKSQWLIIFRIKSTVN